MHLTKYPGSAWHRDDDLVDVLLRDDRLELDRAAEHGEREHPFSRKLRTVVEEAHDLGFELAVSGDLGGNHSPGLAGSHDQDPFVRARLLLHRSIATFRISDSPPLEIWTR